MIGTWMVIGWLASSGAALQTANPEATHVKSQQIEIEPRKGSGVLAIKSPLAPGEFFEFVTIEALIDSHSKDSAQTELYPLKLEPQDWKVEGPSAGYTWTFEGRARLDFRATAGEGELALEYTLTNIGEQPLEKVLIFPCLPTLGAPSFYPGTPEEAVPGAGGRKARVGRHDYTALYERLFLWEDGKRFSFKDSNLAPQERRLAFMRKGESPLEWSWFVNGERRFDLPLLAVANRDGTQTLGYTIDRALQASTNCGDGRACVHMVPDFGDLAPGKSATAKGTIYWVRGTPEDVLARFREDYPKHSKK